MYRLPDEQVLLGSSAPVWLDPSKRVSRGMVGTYGTEKILAHNFSYKDFLSSI